MWGMKEVRVRVKEVFRHPDGKVDYTVSVRKDDRPVWNGFLQLGESDSLSALLVKIAETMEIKR